MTALPAASDFTAATATEANFKAALTALHDYLSGLLGEDGITATALAQLGALGGDVLTKSAAWTATVADRGRIVQATGTWSLTLPDASAAGAGWLISIKNTGSGTITVSPAGTDTIDGAASLAITPGWDDMVVSTGTAWIALCPAAQDHGADTVAGRLMTVGSYAAGGTLRPTAGGTANAVTLTSLAPAAALVTGMQLRFRATSANTGAATVNLDGLGAVAARTITGAALPAGYIRTDVDTVATYDGTYWVLGREIERGSNANGNYVRLADGTLMCFMSLSYAAYTTATLTFPVAFKTGLSANNIFAVAQSSRTGASNFNRVNFDLAGTSSMTLYFESATAVAAWRIAAIAVWY